MSTKMLVPLFVLLASSFLAVESAIAFGTCPRRDWGKETTEENWECTNGKSSCSSTTDSCSNDGELRSTAGTNNYDANGNLLPSTGGWDCRQICLTSDWVLNIFNIQTSTMQGQVPWLQVQLQWQPIQDLFWTKALSWVGIWVIFWVWIWVIFWIFWTKAIWR